MIWHHLSCTQLNKNSQQGNRDMSHSLWSSCKHFLYILNDALIVYFRLNQRTLSKKQVRGLFYFGPHPPSLDFEALSIWILCILASVINVFVSFCMHGFVVPSSSWLLWRCRWKCWWIWLLRWVMSSLWPSMSSSRFSCPPSLGLLLLLWRCRWRCGSVVMSSSWHSCLLILVHHASCSTVALCMDFLLLLWRCRWRWRWITPVSAGLQLVHGQVSAD